MGKYTYTPNGVCSRQILIEVDGDIVKNVTYIGGCNGNTQGIGALVSGMHINDVIERLKGIDCGGRGTSCPDQLALALEAVKNQ